MFRRAQINDARVLAELIYLSAQSNYSNSGFDLSLGGTRDSQIKELSRLATSPARTWFHFSHFIVAEVDGQVVGGAAGYDRVAADQEITAALRQIGWTDIAIAELEERLQPVVKCFPVEQPQVLTVDHVAVLSEWRGQGLARGCVQDILQSGKDAGFRKAKLDVFRDNHAARRLYEGLGFQLSETIDDPSFRTLLKRDAIQRMMLTF